ncbi:MAG TPA: hypothetical protein VN939_12940 [Chthoniobacterales bacterium]|nr:hypothetical protein [Chthoniobacterales bacterium]
MRDIRVDAVDGVMADLGTRVPVFVICHLSFVMFFRGVDGVV